MMNAPRRRSRDSRGAAEHGRADRARARRRGPDRGARRRRCRRRLGAAPAAEGRGRLVDPRAAGREARPVRGAVLDDASPRGRRDRRRRARSRRRGAARMDGAVRRRAAGRVARRRRARSRRPGSTTTCSTPCAMIARCRGVHRGAAARSTRCVEAAPGIVTERRWLPARLGRHLRPERPDAAAVVAGDDGRAGAGRGRASGSRS